MGPTQYKYDRRSGGYKLEEPNYYSELTRFDKELWDAMLSEPLEHLYGKNSKRYEECFTSYMLTRNTMRNWREVFRGNLIEPIWS